MFLRHGALPLIIACLPCKCLRWQLLLQFIYYPTVLSIISLPVWQVICSSDMLPILIISCWYKQIILVCRNIFYIEKVLYKAIKKSYNIIINVYFLENNSIFSWLFLILTHLHFFIIKITTSKQTIVIIIEIKYKNTLDLEVFGAFVVVMIGVVVITAWHNLGITQSESNL